MRAVAQLPPDRRPPVHTRAFGKASAVLGEPDLVVDVRPVWETKLAAIRAHRSQSALVLADDDPEAQERLRRDRTQEAYYVWKFED
ncbi:MAG: hypothetical protein A6D92_12965 [Symbiobacterium thermophilum]|uniref:Uncharacterized protein n=1 Tax=Symbiobacterium thermophilum TaxID=2734 RepID=A0A1Y2T508_SYMTR|nr:MAG: hypothetical protein A6D92_12965 [Symbiobacterium thermophilum]